MKNQLLNNFSYKYKNFKLFKIKVKIIELLILMIVVAYCIATTSKECRSVSEATKTNCVAKGDSST